MTKIKNKTHIPQCWVRNDHQYMNSFGEKPIIINQLRKAKINKNEKGEKGRTQISKFNPDSYIKKWQRWEEMHILILMQNKLWIHFWNPSQLIKWGNYHHQIKKKKKERGRIQYLRKIKENYEKDVFEINTWKWLKMLSICRRMNMERREAMEKKKYWNCRNFFLSNAQLEWRNDGHKESLFLNGSNIEGRKVEGPAKNQVFYTFLTVGIFYTSVILLLSYITFLHLFLFIYPLSSLRIFFFPFNSMRLLIRYVSPSKRTTWCRNNLAFT